VDDGEPSGGGFTVSQTFTVTLGMGSTFFDFGFADYAEVGGLVWEDTDGDGIQNGVITGYPNVVVELFDAASVSQGTTLTAGNGAYLFPPQPPGNYYLNFNLPPTYIFSPQDQGGDDNLDSDPDRTTGNTITFALPSGAMDLSRDAGIYRDNSNIFDPPYGYKTVNNSGWPTLVWAQVWINNSNISANRVNITDPIPTNTTYIPGSLSCNARNSSSTTTCTYDGINDEIIWEGTIAADPGAVDEATAAHEVVIQFETTVTAGIPQVENQSNAYWDENGDTVISPLDANVLAGSPELSDDPFTAVPSDPTVATRPISRLPETGFAPGRITALPGQTPHQYITYTGLSLIIPQLGKTLPIVGIPYSEGSWDTAWLGVKAGYLEGSAFPTQPGNTVITAHVWDSYNQPGPFLDLKNLSFGDIIMIQAWGKIYHYQIQENISISPDQIDQLFKHQTFDWVSLITCEGWDESTESYNHRRVVRGILIKVITE
jgi:LPXTG-site transpeptidase (sortase) family protein